MTTTTMPMISSMLRPNILCFSPRLALPFLGMFRQA
jgi:hypothetical protein